MYNVHYSIAIANPLKHLFAIQIDIQPTNGNSLHLTLPNWIPGSYMIRDFSKHILDFSATDKDGDITAELLNKSQYKLQHRGQPITVRYHVYAFDLSVRKAYLDQEFGFINTASSLFQVDEFAEQACLITLQPPAEALTDCQAWIPATGLTSVTGRSAFEYGDFTAPDYLSLTDYPVLYGALDIAEFSVNDIPHYMVVAGKHFGDLDRVVTDLKPLCQYHVDTFGELPADLDQYLFMTMVTDNGFGGLEHLNSTALVCSRFDIADSEQAINEDYTTFLSLCSHEYLHTWNVKRLKPREFIPYDLSKEVYTQQLWFYEGMTSYFDDLSLVQTNTITPQAYLDILAKTLTRIEKGQGQMRQSVTQSSFEAWTKFYQQDHTAPDQIVSYYQKGAAIACLADVLIRQTSNHTASLRTLMQEAWQQYGRNNLGTTQLELEALFIKYLGEDHRAWLEQALYGKDKLELTALLAKNGIKLSYLNQSNQSQTHGNTISENEATNWLGAVTAEKGGLLTVKQVLADSPIEAAGVAVGDDLVALDGMRITTSNLPKLLNLKRQTPATLQYFRKDQLYTRDIQLTASPEFLVKLTIDDQDKLNAWLASK